MSHITICFVDPVDPDNIALVLLAARQLENIAIVLTGRPVNFDDCYDSSVTKIIELATVRTKQDWLDAKLLQQADAKTFHLALKEIGYADIPIYDGGIAAKACISPEAHAMEMLFMQNNQVISFDAYTELTQRLLQMPDSRKFLEEVCEKAKHKLLSINLLSTKLLEYDSIDILIGGPATGVNNLCRTTQFRQWAHAVQEVRMMGCVWDPACTLLGDCFNNQADPNAFARIFCDKEYDYVQNSIFPNAAVTFIPTDICKQWTDLRWSPDICLERTGSKILADLSALWTRLKGGVQPMFDITVLADVPFRKVNINLIAADNRYAMEISDVETGFYSYVTQ